MHTENNQETWVVTLAKASEAEQPPGSQLERLYFSVSEPENEWYF